MKGILRKLRIIDIDVLIYSMSAYVELKDFKLEYVILNETRANKKRFYIEENDYIIHESFLYPKVYLLRILNKKGPVIGDCFTHKKYRGQSIYPYVINQIAKNVLVTTNKEVFVIVNRVNLNSIKGIEKAGFSRFASVKARRWLWFYLDRDVNIFKNPLNQL